MTDPTADLRARLERQAERMQNFLDELDRIESASPQAVAGADEFVLPYTSSPSVRVFEIDT